MPRDMMGRTAAAGTMLVLFALAASPSVAREIGPKARTSRMIQMKGVKVWPPVRAGTFGRFREIP